MMIKIEATYRNEADGAEVVFSDEDFTITRKGNGFAAYDTESGLHLGFHNSKSEARGLAWASKIVGVELAA